MTYEATQMKSPETLKIAGLVINQFRNNLAKELTDPIMKKHGVDKSAIEDDAFYSASIMDDIYREIFSDGNGQQALVAMGKASAKITLDFVKPETPKDVLDNIHTVFTAYLRGMPDGFGMIVTKLEERKFELWNNTQVPNDLIYGFIWECVKETRPTRKNFLIKPLHGYDRTSEVGARFEVSWDV